MEGGGGIIGGNYEGVEVHEWSRRAWVSREIRQTPPSYLSKGITSRECTEGGRWLPFFSFLQQILSFINFTGEVWSTTSVRMVCEHDLPMGVFDLLLQN